jgi:hypothetical protein
MESNLSIVHIDLEFAIKHTEVCTGDELCNGGSEFLADPEGAAGDILEMFQAPGDADRESVVCLSGPKGEANAVFLGMGKVVQASALQKSGDGRKGRGCIGHFRHGIQVWS